MASQTHIDSLRFSLLVFKNYYGSFGEHLEIMGKWKKATAMKKS